MAVLVLALPVAAEEPPAPMPKPPLSVVAAPAAPAAPTERKVGSMTGLPLPRFVSLGQDKVNARVGPGQNYPIAWVYSRRNLPVELVGEYELYRKIRDREGAESWVHKSQLQGKRYALVEGGTRDLRDAPDEKARVTVQAESGVQVRVLKCKDGWCQVDVQGTKGFGPISFFWGVYSGETVE
jgi:SH3-like domain-containing protein